MSMFTSSLILIVVTCPSFSSVDEATQAVLAAGYRSSSPEFRNIVNIALSRSGRFVRVARRRTTVK